jgi:hypothetical protein
VKRLVSVLLFGIFICRFSAGAYEVSTEVQKKKILLEEFTGIHCVYCPYGHQIANNLILAQPENVFSIAIHSGHYAVPNTGEPDFRIEEGEIFDSYFGANTMGYPCGMINRRPVQLGGSPNPTGPILNRSSWTEAAKLTHYEEAPVNLWLAANFDGSSRKLTIHVEGYYTGDVDQIENFLHVAITQNNIIGPQSGGLLGDQYVHKHTLRALVTPTWGDTIAQPEKEQYFTRQFVYTLPADIKGTALAAENIDVIAFVTADKGDILNVEQVQPTYINHTKPLKITLSQGKDGISPNYAYHFFDVTVKNESHYKLDSIRFSVKVNDETQTVDWTGQIPSYQHRDIRLEVLPYTLLDNNTFEIQAVKVNNTAVSNTKINGAFRKPVQSTQTVRMEIKTDVYADENRFYIRDMNGGVVHEFGPYPAAKKATYDEALTFEAGKIYCFEVQDLWGNGIANGSYKLWNANGKLFAESTSITTFGDRVFFQTDQTGVTAVNTVKENKAIIFVDGQKNIHIVYENLSGENKVSVYDVSGQCVISGRVTFAQGKATLPASVLKAGVYIVRIGNSTGKVVL